MNSFGPDSKLADGRRYNQFKYEQIVFKEIQIAYALKGAITFENLDSLSEYDLEIILDSIRTIRKAEEESRFKAAHPNEMIAQDFRKSRFDFPGF